MDFIIKFFPTIFQKECAFYIFILKQAQNNLFPLDIIQYICQTYIRLFEFGCGTLWCGYNNTILSVKNHTYEWGNTSPIMFLNDTCVCFSNVNGHEMLLRMIKHEEQSVQSAFVLYGRGNNCYHQIDENDTKSYLSYQKIKLTNVKYVACGAHHTVAFVNEQPQSTSSDKLFTYTVPSKSNKIYSWGTNTTGVLGLGDRADRSVPTEINFESKFVSCGSYHNIAIGTDNKIYGWGYNAYGQLGLSNNQNYNIPAQIDLPDIIYINCGYLHTAAINNKHELWVWGYNLYGQLGIGTGDSIINSIYDSPFFGQFGISGTSDNLNDSFCRHNRPIKNQIQNVLLVSCGEYHTIIMTEDGLYSTGRNNKGQLGLGHNTDQNLFHKINLFNVIAVSCGANFVIAITSDGEVYGWGDNSVGQLGLDDYADRNIPTKISITI